MAHKFAKNCYVEVVEDDFNLQDLFTSKKKLLTQGDVDVLYIANLGEVIKRIDMFREHLPNVDPFYAVKCNDDLVVLSLLAKSGLGFDCASQSEMETILRLGVSPDKVIFAHPTKRIPHLEYAKKHNVAMMTFDSESELHKIKEVYADAKLVLRINVDSPKSTTPMGRKFGVVPGKRTVLLEKAKKLDLNVVGVSYHVGNNCINVETYRGAVEEAKKAFDEGASLGYKFTLLDIGGGFPGAKDTEDHFHKIAAALKNSFKEHFPISSGVKIIAEPGRYFVDAAFSCASEILAVKSSFGERSEARNGVFENLMQYYLSDSIFTSFYPGERTADPKHMKRLDNQEHHESVLWGVSCHPVDYITENVLLPKMETGDLLYFENMGAYSISMGSHFNGYGNTKVCYVIPKSRENRLAPLFEAGGLMNGANI